MAARGRKINPDKIDANQPRITDFFPKVKGTSSTLNTGRPDGTSSDIEEKGENPGDISGRNGSELSRELSLGGEAEMEEDVPPVNPSLLNLSETEAASEVQGPSEISSGSTNLKPSRETEAGSLVVTKTQSGNIVKGNMRREYKSMETVPVSPTESSDNSLEATAKENDGVSYVFFSLEIGRSSALRRIVAVHDDDDPLDIPVLSPGVDFDPGRSYHCREALIQFITFLEKIPSPVLVGHNAEVFQCLELCRVSKNNDLWEKFVSLVPLFVDTLTVFKEEYPDEKQFKINDLTKIVLGENALPVKDDLLEEVKALREICLLDRKDKSKIKDKFHEDKSLMRSLGLPRKRMVNHKVSTNEQ